MMGRLISALWLTAIWVVLWGNFDARSVIGGLIAGAAIVWVFPPRRTMSLDAFRPLAVVRFLVVFAWQIVSANAVVTWEVLTPGSRVNEGIVRVPISGASDAVVTVLANVISGTPGTLIIEVEREPQPVLYVHILHLRDIESARRDIVKLEYLLVRAIGSKACIEAVRAHLATLGESPADSPAAANTPDAASQDDSTSQPYNFEGKEDE